MNVTSTETTTGIMTTDATANQVTSANYSSDPRNETNSTYTTIYTISTDGTVDMAIKELTSDTTPNEMSAINNSTIVAIKETTLVDPTKDITTRDSTTDNDKKASSDITMETTTPNNNNTTEAIATSLITEISRNKLYY